MMRDRKHLVSAELKKLLAVVKGTRHEARDHCLLLLMFQHGLRASEACKLRLSQVDTDSRILHVTRLKDRLSTTHPLKGVPRGRPHVLNSAWQLSLSELASDSRAGLTPQIGKGSRDTGGEFIFVGCQPTNKPGFQAPAEHELCWFPNSPPVSVVAMFVQVALVCDRLNAVRGYLIQTQPARLEGLMSFGI
jgi:integrase